MALQLLRRHARSLPGRDAIKVGFPVQPTDDPCEQGS
jgi:hypothetical protein